MRLTKKDREIIKDKIEGKKIIIDDKAFLSWEEGKCEYNIDVKPKEVFTKEQYSEIYRIVNEAVDKSKNEILDVIERNREEILEVLARNGFK